MAVLNDFLKNKKAKECSICQSFRTIFFCFLNFFFVKSIFHGKQKLKKEDKEERRILTP